VSQENVATVQAYFAAFDRGELPEAAAFLHEDVEWNNFALIDEEVHRGRAAVLAYWERLLAVFPFQHYEHEFIDGAEGMVCVLARIRVRGPKSGAEPPSALAGYALTLRDGQITRSDFFKDGAQARKAVRLAEERG
jgi:ketosteroid isomerase-like protein